MTSLPWISIPTVALFFAEVRGYSKLYDNVTDYSMGERHFPLISFAFEGTAILRKCILLLCYYFIIIQP